MYVLINLLLSSIVIFITIFCYFHGLLTISVINEILTGPSSDTHSQSSLPEFVLHPEFGPEPLTYLFPVGFFFPSRKVTPPVLLISASTLLGSEQTFLLLFWLNRSLLSENDPLLPFILSFWENLKTVFLKLNRTPVITWYFFKTHSVTLRLSSHTHLIRPLYVTSPTESYPSLTSIPSDQSSDTVSPYSTVFGHNFTTTTLIFLPVNINRSTSFFTVLDTLSLSVLNLNGLSKVRID